MSREHQRYSPANQAAAISRYAAQHGFQIVRTYRDDGRSGLTLANREGLRQLLSDVLGGGAEFSAVLVLDVSRWGRFQDADQVAHYEWVCREAGVAIHYCAEPFENDGSTGATLIKQIKRVMAAEYSRELGRKVFAGQVNLARLGFKQGGIAPYGLRRMLVDAAGRPVRSLKAKEWKSVQNERVVLVWGPENEIDTVKCIFRWFVSDKMSLVGIQRRLLTEGRKFPGGAPITMPQIRRMLRNEVYRGVYTYNRTSQRMQQGTRQNSSKDWIRTPMMRPIVSAKLFEAARRMLDGRTRQPRYSDRELLDHLRSVAEARPSFKGRDLDSVRGPSAGTYYNRFGSLERALELCGWDGAWRRRKRDPEGRLSKAAIIQGLKRLLREKGHLSGSLIDSDPGLPSATGICRRFGSLLASYRAAGWDRTVSEVRVEAGKRRWRVHGYREP